ncbi:hypothetical protein MVEN_02526800 [Mycena venus]|uniref:Uncharacterized protein n=1 Tax=Mycena venus TaxID=2733690 RepID=A0A8H6WUQ8_9AGAR|nr:hypothetical protein MVEN_02526800 [Mycena venus]
MTSPEATFSQRAREWKTTPFIAEWLENTFVNCSSGEGKKAFENWTITKWGAEEGSERIRECNKRVPRGKWVPDTNSKKLALEETVFMWKASAFYIGVTLQCMHHWHEYASQSNLFQPERKKPAPKRRPGESSGQWLSRVNEMASILFGIFPSILFIKMKTLQLLDGHKLPNIDLENARRIAISEYDKILDTLELWRTDGRLFVSDILSRSKSIIPSPHVSKMDARSRLRKTIDDTLRTRIAFLSMVHLAWKDAAELFEYLAEKGLNAASAVERAYQKDHALLWRFMSMLNRTQWMARKMWANFSQLVAASDHFKPLLKTWRDDTGLAHIDADIRAIQERVRRKELSRLDEVVIHSVTELTPPIKSFLPAIDQAISDNPAEAKKFSAAVFDAMGDVAATYEFIDQFLTTPFGNRLIEYASAIEAQMVDRKQMRSIIYFMDPIKLPYVGAEYWDRVGEVSRSIRQMEEAWSSEIWRMDIEPIILHIEEQEGTNAFKESFVFPLPLFNHMWLELDTMLWIVAQSFDRKGEEGRVAKEFGLFDPGDPNRPMASEFLLRSLDPELGVPVKAKTTPAPYVQNIPVARQGDSIVQSGFAYVAGLFGGSTQKEKVKTRGEAEKPKEDQVEEEEEPRILPEVLPAEFKIGKKALKLFHRILEPPEEEKENAPTKGQVRWGDFENGMKRVGFQVVQTAGSSVRFDPPASTARPITFHRPHPDSLLTPHTIKWVGARLKRTYGWTTETFKRGAGDDT